MGGPGAGAGAGTAIPPQPTMLPLISPSSRSSCFISQSTISPFSGKSSMFMDSFSLSGSSGTMLESDFSSSSELEGMLSEFPSEQSMPGFESEPVEAFVAVDVTLALLPLAVAESGKPLFTIPSLLWPTLNAVLIAIIFPVSSCI